MSHAPEENSELDKNPTLLEKNDANLIFFGRNDEKLCIATAKATVFAPLAVKFWTSPKFIQVIAANNHAAAIDTKGNLYQWGSGYFGNNPDQESQYDITLTGKRLSQLDINCKLVAGLNPNGQVYLLDSSKQLQKTRKYEQPLPSVSLFSRLFVGSRIKPTFEPYRMPVVEHGLGSREKFTKLCIGEHHILLLTNQGSLFTGSLTDCGNLVGQLGIGQTPDTVRLEPMQAASTAPTSSLHYDYQNQYIGQRAKDAKILDKIVVSKLLTERPIKDIACGSNHSVILDDRGSVFSFGYNDFLQCGLGPFHPERHVVSTPSRLAISIENGKQISNVYARYGNTVLKVVDTGTRQNSFYACGAGIDGQLGNGTFLHVNGTPTLIKFLEPKGYFDERKQKEAAISFDDVSIGNGHIGAILRTSLVGGKAADTLFLWGRNSNGQLGHVSKASTALPRSTFLVNSKELSKVFCGDEMTLVY